MEEAQVIYPAVDVLMPVPLHPVRLREREYNQSLLLADRLSRRVNVSVSCTNLVRSRHTAPQTELSRATRLTNVRRAFTVQRPDEIAGLRPLRQMYGSLGFCDGALTNGA